jgi:hypothetical protein
MLRAMKELNPLFMLTGTVRGETQQWAPIAEISDYRSMFILFSFFQIRRTPVALQLPALSVC